MKKLLAIIMAVVMVLSLTVIVSADDGVIFEYTSPFGLEIGWTTLFEHGSDEALALYEALATEGAVFTITGTDLTEADMAEDGAWFQLCTQDQANWTPDGDFKTEGVGETYEFTDDGYIITVPADVIYAALSESGLDASSFGYVLNSGNWAKATTKVTVTVAVRTAAEDTSADTSAEASAEAPADAPAATSAATPAEATSEIPAVPQTGITLAVVPAVMALAVVVVTKKK